jgi:PhnB protein
MQWNPYLAFNGNCEEAFAYYESCLRGKIVSMIKFKDCPMSDKVPPEFQENIVHARLTVGDNVLMGGDVPPGMPYEGIKGCTVAVQLDTPEEAERLFAALARKGNVTMPMQETFWAVRFGMVTDQYGVPWSINHENKGMATTKG